MLEQLSESLRTRLLAAPDFEATLRARLSEARSAWPRIQLAEPRVVAWLCERLSDADEPTAALQELRVCELYLTCACANGDDDAIRSLEQTYFREVEAALTRLKPSTDVIEETKQLLRHRLFVAEPGVEPKIGAYSGRGDLGRWLRMVAFREALQVINKSEREVLGGDGLMPALPDANEDLELDYLKRHYREQLETALAQAADLLTERQRHLLRLHYGERLGIDGIAQIFRTHRATAARWVDRARRSLLVKLRRRLLQNLQVRSAEAASIMRLLESRLDVSLGGMFGPQTDE